ncbi:MAG: hypothetical protein IKH68_06355, partial [Erysipelotrichaceae bacterium]|nr:hypothetical protein [Erysipelotrichaceae bacterium]
MNGTSVLKKLLKMIGKYLPMLLLSLFLSALAVVMQMYVPVLFGKMIDCLADLKNIDHVSLI